MVNADHLLKHSLDVFDSRSYTNCNILTELKKRLETLKIDDCILLIDNKEPIDCYNYLADNKFYYKSFFISNNEVRVFIGYI